MLEIEGITLPMAVALGEGDVKTVEDLAGLVPDDLRGWFETKNGERVREPGILEAFALEPADAELLIMRARVAMGWVERAGPEAAEVEEADVARGRSSRRKPPSDAEPHASASPRRKPPAKLETPKGRMRCPRYGDSPPLGLVPPSPRRRANGATSSRAR